MHAQLMGAAGQRLERKPSDVMAFRSLPADGQRVRPITFHVVTAGWPAGSCFIHQPRVASRRPSGSSMRPSSCGRPALDHRPIGLADRARS